MSITPISFPTVSTGSTGSTGGVGANGGVGTVDPVNVVNAPTGPASTGSTTGAHDFGQLVAGGIDQLESLNDNAANLSVKAATGDLTSIHDYTIAATEASTATQLTVAVTNKAIESFNSIMNMQV